MLRLDLVNNGEEEEEEEQLKYSVKVRGGKTPLSLTTMDTKEPK